MHLAKEILGGKYEFILTTHIDKGHIHNHLIFNAVNFTDYHHYHSNKRSYHYIRRGSDRLCKEHGLSVIISGQDKGKSYAEHAAVSLKKGAVYQASRKTEKGGFDFSYFIKLLLRAKLARSCCVVFGNYYSGSLVLLYCIKKINKCRNEGDNITKR